MNIKCGCPSHPAVLPEEETEALKAAVTHQGHGVRAEDACAHIPPPEPPSCPSWPGAGITGIPHTVNTPTTRSSEATSAQSHHNTDMPGPRAGRWPRRAGILSLCPCTQVRCLVHLGISLTHAQACSGIPFTHRRTNHAHPASHSLLPTCPRQQAEVTDGPGLLWASVAMTTDSSCISGCTPRPGEGCPSQPRRMLPEQEQPRPPCRPPGPTPRGHGADPLRRVWTENCHCPQRRRGSHSCVPPVCPARACNQQLCTRSPHPRILTMS